MTRKDFQLIAETLRRLPSFETYEQDGKLYPCDVVRFDTIVRRFTEALVVTNPRFNRSRFENACLGKTPESQMRYSLQHRREKTALASKEAA